MHPGTRECGLSLLLKGLSPDSTTPVEGRKEQKPPLTRSLAYLDTAQAGFCSSFFALFSPRCNKDNTARGNQSRPTSSKRAPRTKKLSPPPSAGAGTPTVPLLQGRNALKPRRPRPESRRVGIERALLICRTPRYNAPPMTRFTVRGLHLYAKAHRDDR